MDRTSLLPPAYLPPHFLQGEASYCLTDGSAPLKPAFLLGGLHGDPEAILCQVGAEMKDLERRGHCMLLAVTRMRRSSQSVPQPEPQSPTPP